MKTKTAARAFAVKVRAAEKAVIAGLNPGEPPEGFNDHVVTFVTGKLLVRGFSRDQCAAVVAAQPAISFHVTATRLHATLRFDDHDRSGVLAGATLTI